MNFLVASSKPLQYAYSLASQFPPILGTEQLLGSVQDGMPTLLERVHKVREYLTSESGILNRNGLRKPSGMRDHSLLLPSDSASGT